MTQFETEITVGTGLSTSQLGIASLSATLAIVVYMRSNTLYARTVTISGTSLTANAEVTVDGVSAAGNQNVRITALSATKAMCVYLDSAAFDTRAVILSISGTTITVNTSVIITNTGDVDLVAIDSTRALFSGDLGGDATSTILSVSGTTITENTPVSINSSVQGTRAAVYSTSKAIVTWSDFGLTITEGIILNISGVNLTANTKKTIRSRSIDLGDNVTFCTGLSGTKAVYGHIAGTASYLSVLTLNGNTFDIGAETTIALSNYSNITAAKVDLERLIFVGNNTGTLTAREYYLSGVSLDELTQEDTDTAAIAVTNGWVWGAPVDSTHIILHYDATTEAVIVTATGSATVSHLWLSTDGGATYNNIGDSAWTADLVGGVVVVPGTAYQTIYAAVGTNLYKTQNGGTNWTLETAIGYEADFLDLEKDNTTVIMANRASGGNRASLWDGMTLTHISTSKSTTGGATAGGNIV